MGPPNNGPQVPTRKGCLGVREEGDPAPVQVKAHPCVSSLCRPPLHGSAKSGFVKNQPHLMCCSAMSAPGAPGSQKESAASRVGLRSAHLLLVTPDLVDTNGKSAQTSEHSSQTCPALPLNLNKTAIPTSG